MQFDAHNTSAALKHYVLPVLKETKGLYNRHLLYIYTHLYIYKYPVVLVVQLSFAQMSFTRYLLEFTSSQLPSYHGTKS